MAVDGYKMVWKLIDQSKERDGVKIPHVLKQIVCEKPTPLEVIRD